MPNAKTKPTKKDLIAKHKQLTKELRKVEQQLFQSASTTPLKSNGQATKGFPKPKYYSQTLEELFRKAGKLGFYRSPLRRELLDTTYFVVHELQQLGIKHFNNKFHFPDSQPEFFKAGSPLVQLSESSPGFLTKTDLSNTKTQIKLGLVIAPSSSAATGHL